MELPPFNWPNPLARVGGLKRIRVEAAYLHDAVLLYAAALKSIIEATPTLHDAERTLRNGKGVALLLRNRTFLSATGLVSRMDANGDAEGNFTLIGLQRRPEGVGLYPIGHFVQTQDQDLPALALRAEVEWVGEEPPLSEPICGFQGEKCESKYRRASALRMPRNLTTNLLCCFVADWSGVVGTVVLGVVLVGLGSGSWLVLRHWRLSRRMDGLLWKIERREVEWEGGEGRALGGSMASLARFSFTFAPLLRYRGRVFAAKRLEVHLPLDNTLKRQLQLVSHRVLSMRASG
jgi:hypothetical protein